MTTLNDTAAACAHGNADVPVRRTAEEKLLKICEAVEKANDGLLEAFKDKNTTLDQAALLAAFHMLFIGILKQAKE